MHFDESKKEISLTMLSRISLIVVFLSGFALSVFISFLPSFISNHQTWLEVEASKNSQSKALNHDLCLHSSSQSSFMDLFISSNNNKNSIAINRVINDPSVKLPNEILSPKPDLRNEAIAAVRLARELTKLEKLEKAMKVLQQAVALSPMHPDVLNAYGEFLETTKTDIVTAEHMYCRALVLSPTHSQALTNRKRTLPLVEEIDRNRFKRVDSKRQMLIQVPESHAGLRRMKKESYFTHIYHTTAIEGNTFTLSQTRSLVENRLAIAGKSLMEHNEIIGMDAALGFINTTLMNRIGRITVDDIKDIHRRVLGYVDPVNAGQFRTTQVFVGDFMPPSGKDIHKLMAEFIDWFNSEEALNLHPIEFAALAHYRLVYIHPFYDGNGRTSRLLMNFVLMQAGYPPIIIKVSEKHKYYQYLVTANDGDVRPFIRFITMCTERTLDEYIWATSDNPNVTRPGISQDEDDRRIILVNTAGNYPSDYHDL